jgi:hypothetical protein
MSDADGGATVDEFVEYCRTQAGLLSGRIQRMGEAADELLDEVDEELAAIRGELDAEGDGPTGTEGPVSPPSTTDPDGTPEDAVAAVEEKQALVEAKQARMDVFSDLAAGYTELAERLQTEVEDATAALERVVEFEAEHDAPAYFPERETLVETVAKGDGEAAGGQDERTGADE